MKDILFYNSKLRSISTNLTAIHKTKQKIIKKHNRCDSHSLSQVKPSDIY